MMMNSINETFSSISMRVCFPIVKIISNNPSICDQLIGFVRLSGEFLFENDQNKRNVISNRFFYRCFEINFVIEIITESKRVIN